MNPLLKMTCKPTDNHRQDRARETERRALKRPWRLVNRVVVSRRGKRGIDAPSHVARVSCVSAPSYGPAEPASAGFRLGRPRSARGIRYTPLPARLKTRSLGSPVVQGSLKQVKTMLDTIRVKSSLPVRSDREGELLRNEISSWSNRSGRIFHSCSKTWHEELSARQRESGFRASIKDGTLTKAEGSLPRIIHGSNGKPIRTPEELGHALHGFLAQVHFVNPSARLEDLAIKRIDLALNLPLDPRSVLLVHRYAKHPMINLETEHYYNSPPEKRRGKRPHRLSDLNTVRLHGTRTTIQIYDKVREVLGGKPGAWPEHSLSTRVEIQLRGAKHIATQLGFRDRSFITLDELNFRDCYLAFRRILMGFDGNGAAPKFKPNNATFLAILERHPETWEALGGVSPLDWWAETTRPSKRRLREVRKEVGKVMLTLEPFRWADHLPMDWLPDIVEVGEDGSERVISSPWNFRVMPGIPGPVPRG